MGGGMRAVTIATIAMGVLILLGTTVILVTIVKRTMTVPLGTGPVGMPEKPFATVLDEPAGTSIVGIASVRDRLAVQLHGGGTDRVVMIDPVSGAVVGRIGLAW
jgi:Na+(H+)/acetate symporter ActP